MNEIDKSQAVDDLLWLSNRLRGVISLSDDIQTYTILKNQSKELAEDVKRKQTEISSLENENKKLKEKKRQADEEVQKKLSDSQVDADYILNKAKEDAITLKKTTVLDMEALRKTVEDRIASVDLKIKDAETHLAHVLTEISNSEAKFSQIQSQIEKLKAKF